MDNTRPLDIPGARGKLEVEGVLGLTYKIRIDGEVVKRKGGRWAIPLRNGKIAKLTSNGILPGFQTLYLDGEPIFKMGAHVSTAAKVTMFTPLILLPFVPIGSMIAVLMIFTNILLVKNTQIPAFLRTVYPAIVAVLMAALLTWMFGLPW
ncbi:hypothetical protein [Demequina subtropica]|uniref:hypothetical protein n=1 Tax=Demequina subtropica TaxID=1638989 RepID=UPI000780A863|nr:hypothetical protein [Demequina subtropica]